MVNSKTVVSLKEHEAELLVFLLEQYGLTDKHTPTVNVSKVLLAKLHKRLR